MRPPHHPAPTLVPADPPRLPARGRRRRRAPGRGTKRWWGRGARAAGPEPAGGGGRARDGAADAAAGPRPFPGAGGSVRLPAPSCLPARPAGWLELPAHAGEGGPSCAAPLGATQASHLPGPAEASCCWGLCVRELRKLSVPSTPHVSGCPALGGLTPQ